jgi:hypothetical protein
VSDLKKQQTLVQELYDKDDETFVNALKPTGALADPFVAELVRRVLSNKSALALAYKILRDGETEQRMLEHIGRLTIANESLLAEVDAVAESFKNAAPRRTGPMPQYIPFAKKYISTHGPTQKASLISAMEGHWPTKRVAISNAINRALGRGDLKESSNGRLMLL